MTKEMINMNFNLKKAKVEMKEKTYLLSLNTVKRIC
jgi:hypothetical protein